MYRFPFIRSVGCILWGVWLCGQGLSAAAQQHFSAGFERDVNRYGWQSELGLAHQAGPWALAVENRFRSDAFILFDNQLSFRDENRLRWQASRPLNARFATHLGGQVDWFSLSRVFSQTSYAGLRFAPGAGLWVEPMAGFAVDRRPGVAAEAGEAPLRTDVGPAYGARFGWQPAPINGYQVQAEGVGTWQEIRPRRGHGIRLLGGAQRQFSETFLGVQAGFSSVRRDAYQSASFLNRDPNVRRLDETVEATTSDTLFASVQLGMPLWGPLHLTAQVDAAANNRLIRTLRAPTEALFFDSDFGRRTLDLRLGLAYEKGRLSTRFGIEGGAETERRQLENEADLPPAQAAQKRDLLRQADFDRGYFTLTNHTLFVASRRVRLSFDGAASILQHDTPTLNADDRDELYYNGLFGVMVQLSRYVQLDVKAFGTYFHTVYLKASRSADNNVQRSLRLTPTIRWQPNPRTDIRFSSEVRATYTVDDFVLPGRRPRDQSAREMRLSGEVEQDFGGGILLRISGSYSDLQLGRFLDETFSEIPFDTLRTYSGWIRLQAGRKITAEVGLRFFFRSDYSRNATVRYPQVDANGDPVIDAFGAIATTNISRPGRDRIEQIGPTCALVWPMRNGSAIRLDGWVTVQHLRQTLYGTLPELAADRIQQAADEGTRTLIPNVALSVLWRF